jgi:hypothetical protein
VTLLTVACSSEEGEELLDKWMLSLLAAGGFEHQNESDQVL